LAATELCSVRLSVHLATARKPTDRELRIADICARKASVFIERARAEDWCASAIGAFQAVLDASAVPFMVCRPSSTRTAGLSISVSRTSTPAAAGSCASGRGHRRAPHPRGDATRLGRPRPARDVHRSRWNATKCAVGTPVGSGRQSAWYHIVASPLEGDLAVWFADITQRKTQERELLEADRRKDEFLATLAHELRNPLAPIRQAARIARSEIATERSVAGRTTSSNARCSTCRCCSTICSTCRASRTGTLQLRKQRTDLQSVVSAAVETARPLHRRTRHHRSAWSSRDPAGDSDPLRLAQVSSNLLTNAAKYTQPRGAIRVVARREQDSC
jgi:hypothetical protein